ncbi:MAG: hypothetical protein JO224_10010 [Pelomonas sp.]|nr:hypothetical protein [Roseateles sp.]
MSARAWLCMLLLAATAGVRADVRDEEIAACRPGEIATWHDGVDARVRAPLVFAYDPAGAPPGFPRELVYAQIGRALQAWAPCGVATVLLPLGQAAAAGTIRIAWADTSSHGNQAESDLAARRLSLSINLARLLHERLPAPQAEAEVQMMVSHEIGHFFGLGAHSRRCVDVMSYYTDGHGGQCSLRDPAAMRPGAEYRASLPTACDIARCRAINAPATAPASR